MIEILVNGVIANTKNSVDLKAWNISIRNINQKQKLIKSNQLIKKKLKLN